MNPQDFKNQPKKHLVGQIENLTKIKLDNPLIKELIKISYDVKLEYIYDVDAIEVDGVIECELTAFDANDGHEFLYSAEIEWNDEYSFDQKANDQTNLILHNNFDLQAYVIEQINLNIPVNLSEKHAIIYKVGSNWEFLSENDHMKNEEISKDLDPRWEKLNNFKSDK
ncbi:hypothetical protein ELUMI_v1c04270 [Williamsoniiplasma luminosum]|uniref:DUF177 domain-containing protein n=1 Tax=Williamsoniiplasma luminosum TaxID=214888 RepID=A0A2K8NWN8_9MOLU|nr:hypothetical protein [Williamsoniiplasma luminosum]ATZ17151.1 hypothetical protein ELUMI_v1c04270 [Williamsoniiplasma luminosum]